MDTFIGESLRPGAEFAPPGLRLLRVARLDVSGSATAAQPGGWTLVEWEADGDDVQGPAHALAEALEPANGWYADFVAGDERVVVFAGRCSATGAATPRGGPRRRRTGGRSARRSISSTGRIERRRTVAACVPRTSNHAPLAELA